MNAVKQIFRGVLLLLLPVMAMAAEPAGFVLMAKGEVYAVQTDHQLRQLKRKSPFYSGESLKTADNAKAQVRFRDGSLISMRADTEIRIDKFSYQEGRTGGDKNIFTLLSGGFRTITGKIGKKDPKNYRMKSSVASIGVRGTTYEVVLDGGLNVAAWQGTIVVENQGGGLTLGAEGLFNFARVSSPTAAPSGEMTPPAALANNNEAQPDELQGESEESAEQDNTDEQEDADSGTDGSSGQGDDEASSDGDGLGDTTLAEPGSDGDGRGGLTNTGGTPTTTASTPDGSEDPIPNCKIDPATQACTTTSIIEAIAADTSSDVVVEFADARIEGVTLDRLAMAVGGGTGFQQMLAGGKAGLGADGKLYIADNGLHPGEAGFDTTAYTQVLTQGAAPLLGVPTSFTIDANHSVTWGVWQATAAAPVELLTNADDAAIFTAFDQPVFWGTATATPVAGITARSGVASYRNVLGFIGGGNSGAISDIVMNLSVNFDTAAATGAVSIYTPTELWNLNLAGAIAGPTLDFTSFSGTVNGSGAVFGEFNSLFTGDNAQAIFSSFDLESIADPNIHVEGLVLVNDANVGDLRLTGVSLNPNQVGMYQLIDFGVTGFDRHIGQTGVDGGSNLYFADNGFKPDQTQFLTAPFISVLSQGAAPELNLYTDATYSVSWGVWDGAAAQAASLATDANNPFVTTDVIQPIHWLTVDPTAVATVTAKTGSMTYRNVIAFGGVGTGGTAINDLFMSLDINFDTAAVLGEAHVYTAASEFWDANLGGNVSGSGLDITSVTGLYNNSSAIDGAVDAMFAGTNAEALAGMLSFEVVGTPSNYVDAMFLLDDTPVQDVRLTAAQQASIDRVGFISKSNTSDGTEIIVGGASPGTDPMFAFNGYLPGDSSFNLVPFFEVVTRNGIAEHTTPISDGTYSVTWGIWDAGSLWGLSSFDPQDEVTLSDPVVWMTVLPTDNAVLSSVSGHAQYSVTSYLNIGDAGTSVYTQVGGLSVDFSSGDFFGDIKLDFSTTSWKVAYSGGISTSGLSVTNYNGVYFNGSTDVAINSEVQLAFTGAASPDAIAGSFNFEVIGDPATFVQGAFLSERDLRLTFAESDSLDRVAITTFRNSTLGMEQWIGRAGDGSGGAPILSRIDSPFDSPQFELSSPVWVMRQGVSGSEAPLSGLYVDPLYPVSWGIWNATGGTPVTQQTDFLNATTVTNKTTPVAWLTVLPTDKNVLSGMSGGVRFNRQRVSSNTLSTTTNDSFVMVDFDTATFHGSTFVVTVGGDQWRSSYDGNLDDAHLNLVNMFAEYFPSGGGAFEAANSTIDLFFTGAAGEALVGAYEFERGSDGSVYIQGQFIIENDLRFTNAEVLTLDRAFVGAAAGLSWTTDIGVSSDGASGAPLLADTLSFHDVKPGMFGWKEAPVGYVIRQDLAPTYVATVSNTSYQVGATDPNFEVSWGAWNGEVSPVKTYSNPANGASAGSISDKFFWMTLQPATNAVIAARTGTLTYANPIAILGSGNNGDIDTGTFAFSGDMNFGTGNLTINSMSFNDPGGAWVVGTSAGVLDGATLTVTSPSVTYNAVTGSGYMNVVLTGPTAEGLAGNFDFTSSVNDTAGVFLVNCVGDGNC